MPWPLAEIVMSAEKAVFGEPCVYTPASTGVPESITAVLSRATEVTEDAPDVSGRTLAPVLHVRVADLTVSPARGDAVTVDGIAYEVTYSTLDGDGGARLNLLRT